MARDDLPADLLIPPQPSPKLPPVECRENAAFAARFCPAGVPFHRCARGVRWWIEDMDSPAGNFISVLKWPALAAALAAAAVALLPAQLSERAAAPADSQLTTVSRVDMRDAMRMLNEGHNRVLDQADRQRVESEQKAEEDAYAFEQARVAAAQEAARKLAEQRAAEQRAAEQRAVEQRAAEMKRVAEASLPKNTPKPKPEPVATGAPLDIVPASGGESAPLVRKPRGPIETVVATVGDVADGIKSTAVSTVTGIKDWFAAAGDRVLGR